MSSDLNSAPESRFQDLISKYENLIKSTRVELDYYKIKAEYEDTIQALEHTIKNICHELKKQVDKNANNLFNDDYYKDFTQKAKERDQIVNKCNHAEETFRNLKCQLDKLLGNNVVLEKVLDNAKNVINERINREKVALEKVQEALAIAENAIVEKEEALSRETAVKEECNHLAKTVGQVMEEAAVKVERNIEDIRKQYEQQIKQLNQSKRELRKELEMQRQQTSNADKSRRVLENKIKVLVRENSSLDSDLQVASQTIVQMELKLRAIETLLDEDKKSTRIDDEIQREIRDFLMNNKQIKERWRLTIDDVTQKLQNEIKHLQTENTSLKAEIQDLKIKFFDEGSS